MCDRSFLVVQRARGAVRRDISQVTQIPQIKTKYTLDDPDREMDYKAQ